MPLLDHFHPPLFPGRPWESFHSRWANSMADALHRILPERYTAEVQGTLGTQIEADVAEKDRPPLLGDEAAQAMPAIFRPTLEVQVLDQMDYARLVAVVGLVRPRNKDRLLARRAFAAQCAVYLQRGIGLVTVDIVTNLDFNVHNEMVRMLD